MGIPLRRARAAPSARFGFLIRVRSSPDFWKGVAGRNSPQRWEAENRRIEAREEAYSRQNMVRLPSVGRVLTMDI